MGAILLLCYFVGLTIALAYAAGGWGLGVAGIVFVSFVLIREFAKSHVLDDDGAHADRHG